MIFGWSAETKDGKQYGNVTGELSFKFELDVLKPVIEQDIEKFFNLWKVDINEIVYRKYFCGDETKEINES